MLLLEHFVVHGLVIECCPRTMCASGQVLEITEPVVDEVGFVYEREAIVDYLRRQAGQGIRPVNAPIAGDESPKRMHSLAFNLLQVLRRDLSGSCF